MRASKFICILPLLFFVNTALGAFSATTNWYIRSGGSTNNGGGFDTASAGVNYANQDAAQYNFTDLASTVGTTNPCVITSASHNFVTADEGNTINITAGSNWTVQRARIVSTAANAATLDRACGSSATLSSGTYYVGGAPTSYNSASDDTFWENFVAGNTLYIKGGATYSFGTISLSAGVAGTATSKVRVIGFSSTPGDNPSIASGNMPILAFGTGSITFATHNELSNLEFTGTPASLVTMGGISKINNVKCTNSSGTANRACITLGNTTGVVMNSDVASTAGYAIVFPNSNAQFFFGNRIHDSVSGIRPSAAAAPMLVITNNIFSGLSTAGIDLSAGAYTGQAMIYGNTLYGAVTPAGIGVSFAASSGGINLISNIISNWTTGVSGAGSITAQYSEKNDFFGNTTARTNWSAADSNVADIATDPGFANAGSGNFSVGPNMDNRGSPSAFPAGLTTSYTDIGAAQRRPGLPRGRK